MGGISDFINILKMGKNSQEKSCLTAACRLSWLVRFRRDISLLIHNTVLEAVGNKTELIDFSGYKLLGFFCID